MKTNEKKSPARGSKQVEKVEAQSTTQKEKPEVVDQKAEQKEVKTAVQNTSKEKAISAEHQAQQISELQNLTKSLIESVQHFEAEKARDTAYYDTLSEVKSAANALIVSQTSPRENQRFIPVPRPNPEAKDCDSPCGCVSDECCTYELILTKVRITSMQNEIPGDSNLGSMEIRVFAHVDGIGTVVPGMFSTLTLHKPLGNPALWTSVNSVIREVSVPKNVTRSFTVVVDGTEVEHTTAENLAFIKDEHGSNSGSISLNCCGIIPEINVEVPFTAGGMALGNRGSIEVRISARKKCC